MRGDGLSGDTQRLAGDYLVCPVSVRPAGSGRRPSSATDREVACWSVLVGCLQPGARLALGNRFTPKYSAGISRPLLDVRGVKFVSLMHPGNHDPGQLPIRHVIRADFDMQDTAATIAQLDLVITVDSLDRTLGRRVGQAGVDAEPDGRMLAVGVDRCGRRRLGMRRCAFSRRTPPMNGARS